MWSAVEVEAGFSALGGVFVTPAPEIAARMARIRGLVFDWDGVFNRGAKGDGVSSTFSEADSMGVNLLRYALWRARRDLPIACVITGEENPAARSFALREHFHSVLSGVKNKAAALQDLCAEHAVRADELLCVFDDVNDLGMARECGVRVLVRRDSSPLLKEYAVRRAQCDYITGAGSGAHAVREAAELLLGLLGAFADVVESRVAWDDDYASYFKARQSVQTRLATAARV